MNGRINMKRSSKVYGRRSWVRVLLAGVALCGAGLANSAMAGCTQYQPTRTVNIQLSGTINPNDFSINEVVRTINVPRQSLPSALYYCIDGFGYSAAVLGGGGANKVFESGLPGIGVRFSFIPNEFLPWSYTTNAPAGFSSSITPEIKVELIKTGTVQGGQISAGTFPSAEYRLDNFNPSSNFIAYRYVATGTINVAVPTCKIAAGEEQAELRMKDVRASNAADPSNGAYHTLKVDQCQGVGNVRFTFNGTHEPLDAYRFKNMGTAKGLAINLASVIGGTHTAIRANKASNGHVRVIPVVGTSAELLLFARYQVIPGLGPVSVGDVTAPITVVVDYE